MGNTIPASSQNGQYLLAVAKYGKCTCDKDGLCSEASEHDNPGKKWCRLCQVLDPEWPCPTLDADADYPDPRRFHVVD